MFSNISKESINIKTATQLQVSEIVDFRNIYYKTDRTTSQWLWQYNTYEPDKAIFTVLRNNKKLIATQGMMPINLKIGNSYCLSAKSEDTLLLPEYRGSKSMEDLYEYAVECCKDRGIKFIWGFTAATTAFQNFGFKVYQGVHSFEKQGANLVVAIGQIFRLSRPLWWKFMNATKTIHLHFKNLRNLKVPKVENLSGYIISNEAVDEAELMVFSDRVISKYPDNISLNYSKQYLDWRIRKHPFLKYEEYQVRQNKKLRAYAFVTLFQGTVSISDMMSEDIHATHIILDRIFTEYYKFAGKFIIMINTSNILSRDTMRVLKKYGFSPLFPWSLVLRDLSNGEVTNLFDITNWNINALWTEGYFM